MNFITSIPAEFNEDAYLEHNPDVAAAIARGEFPSGWSHFFASGYREERQGVPAELADRIAPLFDYQPTGATPPEHLRKRVHGDESLAAFEDVGRLVAYAVDATFGPLSTTTAPQRVLDFGCGCGRVLRGLHHQAPQHEYHGTDIDPEAIDWCQQNLKEVGQFRHNQSAPPLAFDDASFDCVYSISVFTHLPEAMQFEWLAELARITKPGGQLLLTTHGGRLLADGGARAQRAFARKGFWYSKGSGTDGLPDFYQTAFHSHDYVRQEWSRFFEIEDIIEQAVMAHQDLVICRRRPNRDGPGRLDLAEADRGGKRGAGLAQARRMIRPWATRRGPEAEPTQ